jgi:hypothetical protein
MRSLFKLIIPVIPVLFLLACKPSGKAAAQYNNRLIRYQLKVVETQKELTEAINRGRNVDEMRTWLDKFKMQVKSGADSIASVEEFDGRDDFKKTTLKYLGELGTLADNEYPEMIRLNQIPDSLLTRNDEKKAQELLEAVRIKTEKAFATLEAEQGRFAKEYNFEVGKK